VPPRGTGRVRHSFGTGFAFSLFQSRGFVLFRVTKAVGVGTDEEANRTGAGQTKRLVWVDHNPNRRRHLASFGRDREEHQREREEASLERLTGTQSAPKQASREPEHQGIPLACFFLRVSKLNTCIRNEHRDAGGLRAKSRAKSQFLDFFYWFQKAFFSCLVSFFLAGSGFPFSWAVQSPVMGINTARRCFRGLCVRIQEGAAIWQPFILGRKIGISPMSCNVRRSRNECSTPGFKLLCESMCTKGSGRCMSSAAGC